MYINYLFYFILFIYLFIFVCLLSCNGIKVPFFVYFIYLFYRFVFTSYLGMGLERSTCIFINTYIHTYIRFRSDFALNISPNVWYH